MFHVLGSCYLIVLIIYVQIALRLGIFSSVNNLLLSLYLLSKWAEDLIIYNSKEFGFVALSDAYR